MSSTVQACRHLSSSVNFILITCLPPLLPLVFTVVVILPLLSRSCLYSQHNWMKCCCLDGTGTSIVSHQSLLKMTLLCQMTFHLWKERKEKKKDMGLWIKGWIIQILKPLSRLENGAKIFMLVHLFVYLSLSVSYSCTFSSSVCCCIWQTERAHGHLNIK